MEIGWESGVWGLSFLTNSIAVLQSVGLGTFSLHQLRNELTMRREFAIAERLRAAMLAKTPIGSVENVELAAQTSTESESNLFTGRETRGTIGAFGPFTTVAAGDRTGLIGLGWALAILGALLSALGIALLVFTPHVNLANLNLLLVVATLAIFPTNVGRDSRPPQACRQG